MNRKILANVLAASLVFTMAPVVPNTDVDAAQKVNAGSQAERVSQTGKALSNLKGAAFSLDKLVCSDEWWKGEWSDGIQVTESGITLTFKNVTNASATDNYFTPVYITYTGDEPKVGGKGYSEYGAMRSDNYGWGSNFWTSNTAPDDAAGWAKWLEKNKNEAGADYKVSAKLEGDSILMEIDAAGVITYAISSVDAKKPVYLSLTGQGCTLKDIKQVDFDNFTNRIPAKLFVQTLEGKASGLDDMWAEGKHVRGRQYTLIGEDTLELYVGYTGKEKDTVKKGLFGIQLDYESESGPSGIGTEAWGDAWSFGYNDIVTGPAISGNTAPDSKVIEEGHQYKVSITRIGDDVTITYLDLDTGNTHMELVAEDIKLKDNSPIKVHVIAHIGTFQVCEDKLTMPEFRMGNCYTSTEWWANTGNIGDTHNQILKGDGEINWYVGYYENIKNVAGAFSVELIAQQEDLKYFITTGSNIDAWYASEPAGTTHTKGDAIKGVALNSKNIELGHVYKITVKREGQTFTITYFDLNTNSVYTEFVAANTTLPEGDVKVHVKAQIGKYKIEEEPFDVMPEVKDNNTPLATYDTFSPTPAPTPEGEKKGEELEFGGWWTNHGKGIEITSDGIAIAFRNKTLGNENYDTPTIVGYSGDEPKVDGAGYKEYVVIRSDAWAWNPSVDAGAGAAAWEALGYTFTTNQPSDWASWLAANKEGVDCLVQAIRVGNKIYMQIENNGIKTVVSYNVSENEKCYVSLTGEQCKLTNIISTNYTGIDGVSKAPSATVTPDASATPSASPEPGTIPAPDVTPVPGNNDNNTPGNDNNTPGNNNNDNNTPQTPADIDEPKDDKKETKKTMKVSGIKAKKNTKKITGTVSVKNAKVKVKVGNKAYKNAKVNGRKFTFTASPKLKKGTKITIKVTKSGYKTVTKTVKVK